MTGYLPAAEPGVRRSAFPVRRALLWLLGAAMVTGTFVSHEPAPYDILIPLLGMAALLSGALAFSPGNRLTFLLLGGYLAVNVASLAMVQDAQVARSYLLTTTYLAASFVFFIGFLNRYGNAAWSSLLSGYALSGVVASTASVLAYWNILPLRDELTLFDRPKGWFKDPNVFGPYLVVALLYAVVRLQCPRRRMGWLPWIAMLASAALGVCLAFSRACWVNCAVALAVYFGIRLIQVWRTRMVSRQFFRVLVCTCVALAGIGAILVSDSATRRMLSVRIGQGGLQNYDEMRFYTHERALDAGMRKPLGVGPGQAEVVFGYATHSMYLRVLSENGIAGFILFYAMVLGGFVRAGRMAFGGEDPDTADRYAFAFASMAGILANGFVIDVIHWRHFWFVAALTWCSPEIRKGAYALGTNSYARR